MISEDSYRPVTSLRLLCEIATQLGIDKTKSLEQTGLTIKDLDKTDLQLTLGQELRAIENVVRLLPNKVGLGVLVGRQMHVNMFGIWGFAILSSPTLRVAIATAADFMNLSFAVADIALEESDETVKLQFNTMNLPVSIRPYVIERQSVVTMTFIRELLKETDYCNFAIETRIADDDYAAELSKILGIEVIAGAATDGLLFPAQVLGKPLPKSDPITLQYCLEQCESLSKQQLFKQPWSQKVRNTVIDNIGAEQKIDEISARLSVTERTLRRRLNEEGTSFRELY